MSVHLHTQTLPARLEIYRDGEEGGRRSQERVAGGAFIDWFLRMQGEVIVCKIKKGKPSSGIS